MRNCYLSSACLHTMRLVHESLRCSWRCKYFQSCVHHLLVSVCLLCCCLNLQKLLLTCCLTCSPVEIDDYHIVVGCVGYCHSVSYVSSDFAHVLANDSAECVWSTCQS